jgi:hydroxyacylglutathione hydrolase
MFLKKIKSDGLAHLSYMIGSNGKAAIIDPRRDISEYMDIARQENVQITHVFETHRNEDFISGAPAVRNFTGARIFHGPNSETPVEYAETVHEGDEFSVGSIKIKVLETPGHTYDSVSYVLYDTEYDDGPVGVFTGDALFIGDVGRTDFYPDQKREVTGLLFDSLQKLKALGDQTIVYPAHGAGSVCGAGMADREFSTIGHEKANNERFRMTDREAFIDAKVAENHYQPPYFEMMERLNSEGGEPTDRYLTPPPIGPASPLFKGDAQIVDIRSETDFAAAHVPGSFCIPAGMLASFAGWFLEYDRDIVFVSDGPAQARQAALTLSRLGFDRVVGHHAGTVPMAVSNQPLQSLDLVDTQDVKTRVSEGSSGWTLLDVRSIDEFEGGHIDGAVHAYVGRIPTDLPDLDKTNKVTVMCGSGMRASIAASVLKREGFEDVDVYYGSWKAWNS